MKYTQAEKIKASVKETYNAIATQFHQTRQIPWKEFEDFLPYLHEQNHILDLACGNGRLYAFLKQHLKSIHYVGVDQSIELLHLARKQHPTVEFLEQDMENLELPADSFDVLFCIAAFHHLPTSESRKKSVMAMHQVLKGDGLLLLTVWNLFQWKYFSAFFQAVLNRILHFKRGLKWNDLWIKWGKNPQKRYYHAFLPRELKRYFPAEQWEMVDCYFSRKGARVGFWKGFNLVLILKKK